MEARNCQAKLPKECLAPVQGLSLDAIVAVETGVCCHTNVLIW